MKLTVYRDGRYAVEDSVIPKLGKGEAMVKVKACGVCGSDVPRVFKGTSYYYPIVLGHEFAGVVEKSAKSELVGKRVCIFPILPCGECAFCKKQAYANCTHYDYYGSRRDGGMQERLAVKEENLVLLPDNVSYEAGAMIEPTAVCLHAVKKARVEKGESVLVYGAGTIGLLCGMWARSFGAANVYFVDIDGQKLEMAERLGFARYEEQAVEVVIEASGAGACVNDALQKVQAFGRVVLVGNAGADITIGKDGYAKLLRKQLTVCGSWNSDYSDKANDWKESLRAISESRIDPEALITHKFPLSQATKAYDVVKNRDFYNKIMVVTE